MPDIILAHELLDDARKLLNGATQMLNAAIRELPKDGIDLPLFEILVHIDEDLKTIEAVRQEMRARTYPDSYNTH